MKSDQTRKEPDGADEDMLVMLVMFAWFVG
jgi:hypothetical protein